MVGWRALLPPVDGEDIDRAWYVSTEIHHGFAIEAGRASSRRLYRHVGRRYSPVAGGVESWSRVGPDCVLYLDGNEGWAVCGDRAPVKVAGRAEPSWRWLSQSLVSTYAPESEEAVAGALETALAQPLRHAQR